MVEYDNDDNIIPHCFCMPTREERLLEWYEEDIPVVFVGDCRDAINHVSATTEPEPINLNEIMRLIEYPATCRQIEGMVIIRILVSKKRTLYAA